MSLIRFQVLKSDIGIYKISARPTERLKTAYMLYAVSEKHFAM